MERVSRWGATLVLLAAVVVLLVRELPTDRPTVVIETDHVAAPVGTDAPATSATASEPLIARRASLGTRAPQAAPVAPEPSPPPIPAPATPPPAAPTSPPSEAPSRTPAATPPTASPPSYGWVPVEVTAIPEAIHVYAGESLRVAVAVCNIGEVAGTFWSEELVAMGWGAQHEERHEISWSPPRPDIFPGRYYTYVLEAGACWREDAVVDPSTAGFPPGIYEFGAGPSGTMSDVDGNPIHATPRANLRFQVHDGPRPADGGLVNEPIPERDWGAPWTATIATRQARYVVGEPVLIDATICNRHPDTAGNVQVYEEWGVPYGLDIDLVNLSLGAEHAGLLIPSGRDTPAPVTVPVAIAPGTCRTWTVTWNTIAGGFVNGQTDGPLAQPGPWEIRMSMVPLLPVETFTRNLLGDRTTIDLVAR